jgi:hypothetical protein
MLRLKGEPDDSMADGAADEAASGELETFRDHPAFDSRSLPDSDDFEDDGPREGGWSILSDTRGLAIAAAAFVPTFLLVFFGVPYLLEDPSLARTTDNSAVGYVRDPPSDSEWSLAKSLSEALRGGPFDRSQLGPPSAPPTPPAPPAVATTPPAPAAPPATPPPPAVPPVASAPLAASAPAAPALSPTTEAPPAKIPVPSAVVRGSETPAALGDEARWREQTGEPMPGTSVSRPSSGSHSGSAALSLPPAASRVPDPERKPTPSKPVLESRSVPAPRQASATPDPPRAQSEARKGVSDWTPAAAFADRDAAARLASSIERQGYPVEIRQEASSTRPWVVWIGSQPSGGGRRR